MNNLITGKDSSLVSHPPHLTSVWSSSLIPFCAYKTNLNISRNRLELPGITYPLCSSFLPTILEGQLCHELTLNMTSGQGKKNELMLLLDYNEERSLHLPASSTIEKVDRHSKEILNFDTAVESVQGKYIKSILIQYHLMLVLVEELSPWRMSRECQQRMIFSKCRWKTENARLSYTRIAGPGNFWKSATVFLGRSQVIR